MIEVGRNNIIVRNISDKSKEFKDAQYKFSLYDKVLHKYTFSAFSYENGDLYFPSSITLSVIKGIFKDEDVSINLKNYAKPKMISYTMKFQPRDEIQKNAIKFLMKMRRDPENHSRFLSLATGSGKTYVTINVISQLKKKPLIVVDTVDLAQQWKREFLKHTDLEDSDILILSGQDSIDKELKNSSKKVYIAIHRTLGNMITSDPNSINILMNKLGIGIRVFDESHVEFGNICRINSFSNVEYTIYLTATPSRSNFNDNSLYAKIFKSIPYFNGKEIDSEKYHTVVLYTFNSHPNLDDKANIKTRYGFSQAKWANYIENDGYESLIQCINEIFDKFKLLERKKKLAIMLPTINLIKKVKDDMIEMFPGIEIGTFIGEISKKNREAELCKILF